MQPSAAGTVRRTRSAAIYNPRLGPLFFAARICGATMPTEVIMPQMGESIFEGTITKWLKKPGDAVEKDEPLFEISTDKVDAEIPAPASGVLAEIKAAAGETVAVNAVVALIAENAAEADATASAPKAQVPASDAVPKAAGGVDVVMPQMGESIFEGTITKWLKKPGDAVEKDEPLFEISTDKVDAEIPAPASGVLTEIKAAAGETVAVNAVVAVIGGETGAARPTPAAAATTTLIPPAPQSEPPIEPAASDAASVRSSPLVRRIAREKNLDLRQIRGTGSAGRITKEDVLRYIAEGGAAAASALAATPQAASQRALSDELVPMSRMRAIIAERMAESRRTSPHAYTIYKIDMTRVARLRERSRADFERRNGVKLTYMPFIAAAAIEALRKFPIVNASIETVPTGGNAIRYHGNVHLGIAVALEWGLIVPVVREAEKRSFRDLALAIADLAERARTRKLKPEEAYGSTFTLTNSGVFGGEFGTPILNQPESAILAIGGLKKEPVVLTDAEGNDTIAIHSMQTYCLGFDHRTIDGADAGKFMTALKDALESWSHPIL
jgi:pyruvate dehydrogenase E2 component (dihydrolipoamide acetyltransferase)